MKTLKNIVDEKQLRQKETIKITFIIKCISKAVST